MPPTERRRATAIPGLRLKISSFVTSLTHWIGEAQSPFPRCRAAPLFHHVTPKHLNRYVDEFAFRLNEGNVKHHTLHRSRIPLEQVDLSVDDSQFDLFGNECEGVCGV